MQLQGHKKCDSTMETFNSTYNFNQVNCILDKRTQDQHGTAFWSDPAQPWYDLSTGRCVGYINVGIVNCGAKPKAFTQRRLCKCT